MADPAIAYLSADVLALTGASESYLSFLVREGIARPIKHRNGKTNLFSAADIERVRWALENRGHLSLYDMRAGAVGAGRA